MQVDCCGHRAGSVITERTISPLVMLGLVPSIHVLGWMRAQKCPSDLVHYLAGGRQTRGWSAFSPGQARGDHDGVESDQEKSRALALARFEEAAVAGDDLAAAHHEALLRPAHQGVA